MSLPASVQARTKQEWSDLANSTDAQQRLIVGSALISIGVSPTAFMRWPTQKKVNRLLEEQGDVPVEEKKASDEPPPKKAAAGTGTTEKKAPKKKAAAQSASSSSVDELKAEVVDLQDQVAGLAKHITDVGRILEDMNTLVLDAHMLIRVLVQSDERVGANSDDALIQQALYGKTVYTGNA